MIYLDYAKAVAGGYILNFFADTEEDIAEVSNGKHFITKNGIDYGVPQPSSTVVITMPDKTKKTYILNEAGEWQLGGGETDYSKLTNVPIILANLADKDFIPEANTYYEHLGETTEDFIKGIIYLYDGKEYKAIDGSGSGAGVQADYNQNDSTAADYIKNRPFYSDVTTENLFNQTFSTASVSGANIWATQDSVIQLTEGETVKVEFGGAEYTQEVKSLNGVLYIGNIALVGMEPNTGESFAVANIYFPAGLSNIVAGTSIATAVAQTNATIKVYKSEDIIKTIDPKYIKDMYYTKPESDTQKTLVFKGEIRLDEKVSSLFEVGDIVSLKEEAVGLDVIDEAKSVEVNNETFAYIGNLSLLAALLEITGAVDTKEDYCALCGYSNGSPSLLYYNKNSEMPNNIEVYKGADLIVRIPEKYLPLDVAKKSYVDTAISDAITKTLNTEV